jgi:fibronectin-binding autotransporter adhesin
MTGNLSLSGSAGTTGVYLELIVDGGLDMTGTISGAITLAMFGTGHLTLTGANTFTGLTSIDGGGTLNVNADAAFGDAANAVSFFGSTLQASANITTSRAFEFSASEGAGMVIDTNGFNVTFDSGSSLTGDKLQKIGAGTLTIAGGQSYDTLTASAGTTVVDSALGTGGSTINAFAGAHVIIRTSQTLAELNIGPGSTVTFTSAIPAPGIGHAVPEPGSLALLLLGALGFSGCRRRGTAVR